MDFDKLKKLKNDIVNKRISKEPMIFIYKGNKFLVEQYINAIADIKKAEKIYLTESLEIPSESNSLFDNNINNYLYIKTTEKLSDFKYFENCIYVCKEIVDNRNDLKPYIYEFPELENKYILEYAKTRLKGLSKVEIEWLCNICGYNIYRIASEIDKIALFDKDMQEYIFQRINEDDGYSDLSMLNIYNFTSAIIKKDLKMIKDILEEFDRIDIEPTGVVTILKKNFRNIIDIQMNLKASPELLNMPEKQFKAIKYNCGRFTNEELVKIYELLTSIDIKLKTGLIDNKIIVDYLLSKIL